MANPPNKHDPGDAEEVDRLLRQLILDDPPPARTSRPPYDPTSPRANGRARSPAPPRPGTRPPVAASPRPLVVWGRVGLAAALAGALTQWPYATCGIELAAYLGAVSFLTIMALWGSHSAWKARMGWAHTLSLFLLTIAAAYAAHQILPRVGYAAVHLSWECVG